MCLVKLIPERLQVQLVGDVLELLDGCASFVDAAIDLLLVDVPHFDRHPATPFAIDASAPITPRPGPRPAGAATTRHLPSIIMRRRTDVLAGTCSSLWPACSAPTYLGLGPRFLQAQALRLHPRCRIAGASIGPVGLFS